jgi:RNA polymerase sigma factor (TIGR02999 family)
MNELTRILDAIGQGNAQAAAQLLPLVYDELRRLAAAQMAREKPGQTLNATALVHEAYLRLVGDQQFENRRHFFAAAAEAMRRILVETARRKNSLKRGGDRLRLDLNIEQPVAVEKSASRAGRGPGATRGPRPGQGTARETPLLRRHDHRTGGRNSRHLRNHS